jgi:hypothetical protein
MNQRSPPASTFSFSTQSAKSGQSGMALGEIMAHFVVTLGRFTNTTKHGVPMANVVRFKPSFASAPIHSPLRAEPAHQQPVLLPILTPPDFRDSRLRDRNERLPLATAVAAAWPCVVAHSWHGATRQPG